MVMKKKHITKAKKNKMKDVKAEKKKGKTLELVKSTDAALDFEQPVDEKSVDEKPVDEKSMSEGLVNVAEEREKERKAKEEEEKAKAEEEALKEKKRLERLAEAATGVIQDARVFKLMYLEKCAIEATLQIQVRRSAYEARIIALRQEMAGVVQQWEATQSKSVRKISNVRREIEEDYGIYMNHWGYDDETGVLQQLPQEIVDENTTKPEKDSKLNTEADKNTTGGK